jgi:predicted secreted acid phosphatase
MTRLKFNDTKCRTLLLLTMMVLSSVPLAVRAQTYPSTDFYSVSEPPNLGVLQDSINSYIKSGAYERGIQQVIDSAESFIESRYHSVKNPAIVLDIDETSLSNIQFEYHYNFGFEDSLWNAWVKEAAAPAIKPTLELAKWAARERISIFFISGREQLSKNISSDPTVRNLKRVGYPKWSGIYFKNHRSISTADFKTSARKEIASKGYTIIANIGDQYSDFVGGYAEGKFKLPDPMYYIP